MLYHSAICEAARQRDWKLVFHRRGEEPANAAEALQASTHEVERFMNDLRQTLKPPWTAETSQRFCSCDSQAEEAVKTPRSACRAVAERRGWLTTACSRRRPVRDEDRFQLWRE